MSNVDARLARTLSPSGRTLRGWRGAAPQVVSGWGGRPSRLFAAILIAGDIASSIMAIVAAAAIVATAAGPGRFHQPDADANVPALAAAAGHQLFPRPLPVPHQKPNRAVPAACNSNAAVRLRRNVDVDP